MVRPPPERGERSDWMALGDHVDYLLVMMQLALPHAVWPLGSAPRAFPVVEASRVALGAHQVRELLDCWWAAAPPVPEWWSVGEVNEAPAKYSQMTWAAAAPSQAPVLPREPWVTPECSEAIRHHALVRRSVLP